MIAQIKPNGLAAALCNLERQRFAVLAPRIEVTRRRGGRMIKATEPVFPGYLFVRAMPDSAPFTRIAGTLGVTRLLLTADRQPAHLPQDFVSALRARCDDEGRITGECPAVGDRVRIVTGPFAEMVTRIEALQRDGRLQVLMNLLGQAVRVTLSPGQVRPA